jgi:hypothetical protein
MPPSPKRTNASSKKGKRDVPRGSTWVERVVESRAKKKGFKEELTLPVALAAIGIIPARAERLIAWNIKRIPQFSAEHRREVTRACIDLYRRERQRLIEQQKGKK